MPERINNGIQPPIGCGWSDQAVPADETQTLPPETSPAPEGYCDDQTGFCSSEPILTPDRDIRPPAVPGIFTPNPDAGRSRERFFNRLHLEIWAAHERPLPDRLERLNDLLATAVALGPEGQGSHRIQEAEAALFATLIEFLDGSEDPQAVRLLQERLHEAVDRGEIAWITSLSPGSIRGFLRQTETAQTLLAEAQSYPDPNDASLASLEAATLFSGLGLRDATDEAFSHASENGSRIAQGMLHLHRGNFDGAKEIFRGLPADAMAQNLLRDIETLERTRRISRIVSILQAVSANDIGRDAPADGIREAIERDTAAGWEEVRRLLFEGECRGVQEAISRVRADRNQFRHFWFGSKTGGVESRVNYFLDRVDDMQVRDEDLSREAIALASELTTEGHDQAAGEIYSLFSEDPVAREALDSLPTESFFHGALSFFGTGSLMTVIPPFAGARAAGLMAEAAFTARAAAFIRSPITLRLAGFAARTVPEAAAFTASNMAMTSLLTGRTDHWTVEHFAKEFGAMLVTFNLLHGTGLGMGQVASRTAHLPVLRATMPVVNWTSRVTALTASGAFNRDVGLSPAREGVPVWGHFVEGALMDAQMALAHRAINGMTGGALTAMEARTQVRYQRHAADHAADEASRLLAARGPQPGPLGEDWEVVAVQPDAASGGSRLTIRPRDPAQSNFGFEKDPRPFFRQHPALAERLGVEIHPDGSITLPDITGLNHRLREFHFPFRFWASEGEAPYEEYLRHLAMEIPEFPLDQNGLYFLHDGLGLHGPGYLSLPNRVFFHLRDTARFLLDRLDHTTDPERQSEIHEAIRIFVDGVDQETGNLGARLARYRFGIDGGDWLRTHIRGLFRPGVDHDLRLLIAEDLLRSLPRSEIGESGLDQMVAEARVRLEGREFPEVRSPRHRPHLPAPEATAAASAAIAGAAFLYPSIAEAATRGIERPGDLVFLGLTTALGLAGIISRGSRAAPQRGVARDEADSQGARFRIWRANPDETAPRNTVFGYPIAMKEGDGGLVVTFKAGGDRLQMVLDPALARTIGFLTEGRLNKKLCVAILDTDPSQTGGWRTPPGTTQARAPKRRTEDLLRETFAEERAAAERARLNAERWEAERIRAEDQLRRAPSEIQISLRPGEAPETLHLTLGEGRRRETLERPGIASGTHEGIGYKKGGVNEDRFLVVENHIFAIDGMGGYLGGERAAEIARVVLQRAAESGLSITEAVRLVDRAIRDDNLARPDEEGRPANGGAVVMGVEISPKGEGRFDLDFHGVGDAEAIGIRIFPDGSVEIPYWMARPPTRFGWDTTPERTTGDGRRVLEDTLKARLHPNRNVTDRALGGEEGGATSLEPDRLSAEGRTGDIVLVGTDGLFENFGTYTEIAEIIRASGERTAGGIRRVLMEEALIRMRLYQMASEAGRPIELTRERYLQAYRETAGREPPDGWSGRFEGYLLSIDGHSGYVGRRENFDRTTGQFRRDENGLPQAVANFKPDNATLVVEVLGEGAGEPPGPAGGDPWAVPGVLGIATFLGPAWRSLMQFLRRESGGEPQRPEAEGEVRPGPASASLPADVTDLLSEITRSLETMESIGRHFPSERATGDSPLETARAIQRLMTEGNWLEVLKRLVTGPEIMLIPPLINQRERVFFGNWGHRRHPRYRAAVTQLIRFIADQINAGTTDVTWDQLRETIATARASIDISPQRENSLSRRLGEAGCPIPSDLAGSLRHLLSAPQYRTVTGEGLLILNAPEPAYERLVADLVREVRQGSSMEAVDLEMLLRAAGRDRAGVREALPEPWVDLNNLVFGSTREEGGAAGYAAELRRLWLAVLDRRRQGDLPPAVVNDYFLDGIPEREIPHSTRRILRSLLESPDIEALLDRLENDPNGGPSPQTITALAQGTVARAYEAVIGVRDNQVADPHSVLGAAVRGGGDPLDRDWQWSPFTRPRDRTPDWQARRPKIVKDEVGRFYFALRRRHAHEFWETLNNLLGEASREGRWLQAKIARDPERFDHGDSAVLYFDAGEQAYFYERVAALVSSHPDWFHNAVPVFAARLRDPAGNVLRGVSFGQNPRYEGSSFNTLRAGALEKSIRLLRFFRLLGAQLTPEEQTNVFATHLERAGVDPAHPAFNRDGIDFFPFIWARSDQFAAPSSGQ